VVRSSRSSGRSATTAAASVNTFRRAHNPFPNIIIPSPPRGSLRTISFRVIFAWPVVQLSIIIAPRSIFSSWFRMRYSNRCSLMSLESCETRRDVRCRYWSSSLFAKSRAGNRINKCHGFAMKSVTSVKRKRMAAIYIAGVPENPREIIMCVIIANKSMLSLDCLSDNEFHHEIIRSAHTRENPYRCFFPSSRKHKERWEKGEGKRRESLSTCAIHEPSVFSLSISFVEIFLAIDRDASHLDRTSLDNSIYIRATGEALAAERNESLRRSLLAFMPGDRYDGCFDFTHGRRRYDYG